VWPSSRRPRGPGRQLGSWVADGWIYLEEQRAIRVSDIRLPGAHNLENCLAAGTAALARGLELRAVAEGLGTFSGVAHRLRRQNGRGGDVCQRQ